MLWVYGHYNILILSAREPALTLSHVFLFPLVFSVVLSTYDEITYDKPLDDTVLYDLPPLDTTTYEEVQADINVYEMPCLNATSSETDLQPRDVLTYETLSLDTLEKEEPSNESCT